MNKANIKILDCTLRDGGYVNDWNFSEECYYDITNRLQDAGVDMIELGLMGKHNDEHFKTKFRTIEEIPVPEAKNDNVMFTVMMTGNEYKNLVVPDYKRGLPEAIRFAFFKADSKDAVSAAGELISKGYKVFMQTMATFQYSDEELDELVSEVNKIKPYAFYMVDSFGTFYTEDVKNIYSRINESLDKEILLGFHAHNNLQMANANVIQFINCARDRDVIVDGSIYGMGRGAGNECLELILHYLERFNSKYNERPVWELYKKHISAIREKYSWGYLPEQYMVSKYGTNPAYVWYLSKLGITDLFQIEQILQQISDEKRYTLYKVVIDKLLNM